MTSFLLQTSRRALSCLQPSLAQSNVGRFAIVNRGFATDKKTTEAATSVDLPKQARAVIVGGGIIGCSVAYHLAKLGWKDIVLLEQGQLTGGTTWHAAGLIGQMRPTSTETALSVYGANLYQSLEAETGQATGYKRCGSLTVARNQDRMINLQRNYSRAKSFGIEAELIGPAECGKLWPLMRTDDLEGGLWLPGDGSASPSDLCMAFAKGARSMGAKLYEGVRVTDIHSDITPTGLRVVKSVSTEQGDITADVVVIACGQWSRQLGRKVGVNVPLHSAEHFYIVTKPIEGVTNDLPVMRDPDAFTYWREWSGGILMGGFEPNAKPCFSDGVPHDFKFGLLEEDWDHFDILMQGALERMPTLAQAEIRQFVNGPESFTADNQYMIGEAPEVRRLYVAAGFNSSGIASSGGAGKALSEWIVNDGPDRDVWTIDVRRFGSFMSNVNVMRDRTKETLGLHYAMNWPRREFMSSRPLRRTPLYDRLTAKGACFGSKMGWERANWFAPKGVEPVYEYSFLKPNWLEHVGNEHRHCRDKVAVFDQSSFSKFLIQGRDAEKVMQRLCANNVGGPGSIGKVVYTGMLNHRGGFETDVTVMRIDEHQYYIVAPTAQTVRDAHWIKTNFKDDEHVTLTDMTSAYGVLAVMGPKSRELLQKVCRDNLSNEAFPFGTMQEIGIGYANVRAARVTYVGELGWELHVPTELMSTVYDTLMEHGPAFGLKDCGYYAIESLRSEKGYRAWGLDITPDITPLEAGLGFAVAWDKPDFNGKAALLKQKAEGVTRRLAVFVIDDANVLPWGDEPILRDGKLCGYVTTANFGHSLGKPVCMGFINRKDGGKVDKDYIESGTYQIEVNNKAYKTSVSLAAAYDPKNAKVRA